MTENIKAFPASKHPAVQYLEHEGMDLRDYFAAHAPMPDDNYISMNQAMDHNRNPHNEPHKPSPRSRIEIIAGFRFEYADAMMKVRQS